jgi:hypothetical protein
MVLQCSSGKNYNKRDHRRNIFIGKLVSDSCLEEPRGTYFIARISTGSRFSCNYFSKNMTSPGCPEITVSNKIPA